MLLTLVFIITSYNLVQSCVVSSFNGTTVQVANNEIISYRVSVNGCIENTPEFQNALTIDCVDECEVKSLRNGAVKGLKKLKRIKFLSSGITHIERDPFINLPNLITVEIVLNALEFIASGTFNNLPLYKLRLDENRLKSIQPRAFVNLRNLEQFSVSKNSLSVWDPNWFENSPNLKEVSAYDNNIEALGPSAFSNFPNLIYINLANNEICQIDQTAFPDKKVLVKLNLAANFIEHFREGTFRDVFNGIYPGFLDISYNQLMYLDRNTLDSFTALNEITLHPNPWSCACYMKITRWFFENKKKLTGGAEEAICVVPLNDGDKCKEEVDRESMDYFGNATNSKYCSICCEYNAKK